MVHYWPYFVFMSDLQIILDGAVGVCPKQVGRLVFSETPALSIRACRPGAGSREQAAALMQTGPQV